MNLSEIDIKETTKSIRTRLMSERKREKKSKESDSGYYDGVMDALIEVEKCLR